MNGKKLCSSLICGLLSKFKWISTHKIKIASSVYIKHSAREKVNAGKS